MDILRKESGELSLSKIMAAVSFFMLIFVTIVELFTNYDFKHYNELCLYSSGLVALSVGSKAIDMRGRTNV